MRIKAQILLIIFTSFTTLPTVFSCISNKIDFSSTFTMTEEENHSNSSTNVCNEFISDSYELILFLSQRSQQVVFNNCILKLSNNYYEITSPPPEQKLV
ncbi:MAG: hypothetical protein IT246_03715 [Bacteroidia bacterium]|nr:hypothetical protein [Bacteroidia bacterium]